MCIAKCCIVMNGICRAADGVILCLGSNVNIRDKSDMNSIRSNEVNIDSWLSMLFEEGGGTCAKSNKECIMYLLDSFVCIPVS